MLLNLIKKTERKKVFLGPALQEIGPNKNKINITKVVTTRTIAYVINVDVVNDN